MMIVYGVKFDGAITGFSFAETAEAAQAEYEGSACEVVIMAASDSEETVRNIVDFLTYCNDNCSIYQHPSSYNITDGYTLTAEGQAIWPVDLSQT